MSVYRITIPILHCDSCTWLHDGVCGGDVGREGDVGAWRRCGVMQGGWWESGRVVVGAEGGLGGVKPLSYD